MQLIILRHQKLIPPYDDYSKLSLSELDNLSTFKIDPPVQKISEDQIKDIEKYIKNSDKIFTSDSKRCIDTLIKILNLLKIKKEYKIDERLREIWFSPKLMEKSRGENPLELVRRRLYQDSFNQFRSVESLQNINKRIFFFLNDIKDYNLVFCVSHEFLMRIFYFYKKFNRFPSSMEDVKFLSQMNPFEYLEYIMIDLTNSL